MPDITTILSILNNLIKKIKNPLHLLCVGSFIFLIYRVVLYISDLTLKTDFNYPLNRIDLLIFILFVFSSLILICQKFYLKYKEKQSLKNTKNNIRKDILLYLTLNPKIKKELTKIIKKTPLHKDSPEFFEITTKEVTHLLKQSLPNRSNTYIQNPDSFVSIQTTLIEEDYNHYWFIFIKNTETPYILIYDELINIIKTATTNKKNTQK